MSAPAVGACVLGVGALLMVVWALSAEFGASEMCRQMGYDRHEWVDSKHACVSDSKTVYIPEPVK